MAVKIFSSDDRILIHHLKNTLLSEGIECFIKNDLLYSLAGEVPVNEVWPELWIQNAEQQNKAKQLLVMLQQSDKSSENDWVCPQCSERHTAAFTSCWRCGSERE